MTTTRHTEILVHNSDHKHVNILTTVFPDVPQKISVYIEEQSSNWIIA